MSDLIERLSRLNQAPTAPAEQTVAADLARAHGALAHQRRTRAALAGIGLTVAMGASLATVLAIGQGDQAPPPDADPGVELVAYDGEQPPGFDVAQVPDGFVAQGSNPFSFTIAREQDATHPDGFVDKLVVMLESGLKAPGELTGQPVAVNGHPGAVRDSGEALTLEFHDGTHEIVVQMWDSVGLTTDQLVEFAEGVSVTPDARREEPTRQKLTSRTVERDGKLYHVVEPVE